MSADKPSVAYWRLWTDLNGVSHQSRCEMTAFELRSIQPPSTPQWQGRKSRGDMTVMVTVLPVGWTGDWHENPRPQWIIPLSGRWFVQSMDGNRHEFGPGELSLGADQNCRERDGRQGHRSGVIGEVPAVLMLIQYENGPGPSPQNFE